MSLVVTSEQRRSGNNVSLGVDLETLICVRYCCVLTTCFREQDHLRCWFGDLRMCPSLLRRNDADQGLKSGQVWVCGPKKCVIHCYVPTTRIGE